MEHASKSKGFFPRLLAALRRFRRKHKDLLAEFLGTAIIVMFGAGVCAQTKLNPAFQLISNPSLSSNVSAPLVAMPFSEDVPTSAMLESSSSTVITAPLSGMGKLGNYLSVTFGWGFGVAIAVYISGGVSAHLNPAVTLAFAVFEGFPWRKVIPFMLVQTLGGFFGAAVVFLNYYETIQRYNVAMGYDPMDCQAIGPAGTSSVFVTWPGDDTSHGMAFFDEIVGTGLLIAGILAMVHPRNGSAPGPQLAPFMIGILVVVIGISFGANSGYCINPARDLGPRLLLLATTCYGTSVFTASNYYFWIPIVSPLVGALVGGAFFYAFIDLSGEGEEAEEEGELKKMKNHSSNGAVQKLDSFSVLESDSRIPRV